MAVRPQRFLFLTIAWLGIALFQLPLRGSAREPETPVAARVETTLKTASDHIRQFAFDGDPGTYFASEQNPAASDHFTLRFERPVAIKSIAATTGKPNGDDALDAGELQVSADGRKFESVVKFTAGLARASLEDRQIRAIRLQPAGDMSHPLAIREIVIVSDPPVAVFKYPVEFVIDVSDAPEMTAWAEKTARVCEQQYPMINEQLASDGFQPPHRVTMAMKKDYDGVAATGGDHIVGSVKYFREHKDDVGAMVHETVHVVQQYRGRGNPGWLVEGVADYIRFFKYEPGKAGPVDKNAHYNGSYRVTATFLDYVTEKYDKQLVRKLNEAMRAGKYKDDLFQQSTGKTLSELDEEWRATLKG